MTTIIVLANGEIEQAEVLRKRLSTLPAHTVIAADGGSRHAKPLGLEITLAIGDFDSLDQSHLQRLQAQGVQTISAPPRKDELDLELALLHVLSQGADRVILLGALGGRLDMSLANLYLLAHPRLQGIHIEVWAGHQTAWLMRPPGQDVSGEAGDTLSLLPLGGDATGITTHGLEYPLLDGTLTHSEVRGVSNVLTGSKARITFRQGLLLLVHTPGRA
jgi:thiamine pyrophosphokinase